MRDPDELEAGVVQAALRLEAPRADLAVVAGDLGHEDSFNTVSVWS
jgi:hypothetical protein